jgi:hypothetical protein
LAGSTTKKAVIRRYQRETLAGYVNPASFLQSAGVELLSEDGKVAVVPYGEIKTVAFVREFTDSDSGRRVFFTRPKMEGLWVSLKFRDGEVMEGVLSNNLLQLDRYGFMIVPPDPAGPQQRVFVPRAALLSAEVLGVVGSPLKRRKPQPAAVEQIRLFEE